MTMPGIGITMLKELLRGKVHSDFLLQCILLLLLGGMQLEKGALSGDISDIPLPHFILQ